MTPTTNGPTTLSKGPKLEDGEAGVHIIYVPVSLIAEELGKRISIDGPADTAALAQVAKHIGANPFATDIVVFAGKPWHFAGRPGHPRQLQKHPEVHHRFRETVLVLSISNQDRAVWWSEKEFAITAITASGAGHPSLFYPEDPPPAEPDPVTLTRTIQHDVDGRDICVWRSSVPKSTAARHMYKISFEIDGQTIDPDMYCTP